MNRAIVIVLTMFCITAIVGCSSPQASTSSSASSDAPSVSSASSDDVEQFKPYEEVANFMRGESCEQLVSGFQGVLDYLIEDIRAGNVDVVSLEIEKCKAAGDDVPELYAANGDPKSCSFVCAYARLLSEDEVSYLSACADAAAAMKHGDESLASEIMDEAQPYLEEITKDSEHLADAYKTMAAEYDELVKSSM